MKKKIISTLLCASMVATMVAGCGGSSDTTATQVQQHRQQNLDLMQRRQIQQVMREKFSTFIAGMKSLRAV